MLDHRWHRLAACLALALPVLALGQASARAEQPAVAPAPTSMPATATVAVPGRLIGQVIDRASGEPLEGATVVATGTGDTAVSAITEADGRFTLVVEPGTWTVTVYYGELQRRITETVVAAGHDVTLAVMKLATWEPCTAEMGCDPPPVPVRSGPGEPRFRDVEGGRDAPPLRRRDHLGLAALRPGAAPLASTIDGSRRLAGAQPLALALTHRLEVSSAFRTPDLAAGAGGSAAVDTIHGGDHGEGRLWIGGLAAADNDDPDGDDDLAIEATMAGRLPCLDLEVGAGVVEQATAGGHATQGLLRLDLPIGDAQLAGVTVLVGRQRDNATPATAAGHTDDLLIAGRWRWRGDDVEVSTGATSEARRGPGAAATTMTRHALRATAATRLGDHVFVGGVEGGAGAAAYDGRVSHHDATVHLADSWRGGGKLRVAAGVRGDWRGHADRRAHAWSAHATVRFDWKYLDEPGGFVHVARVATLDDRGPGGWRLPGVLGRDEVLAGFARELVPQLTVGAAGRVRRWLTPNPADGELVAGDASAGIDAWIERADDTTPIAVIASSLDRAIVVDAAWIGLRRPGRELRIAVAGRIAVDADAADDADVATAAPSWGVGATWTHRPRDHREVALRFSLEGFDLEAGHRAGRLAISGDW